MKRNLFAFLAFFALTLGVIQAQSILSIQGQVTDDSTGAAVANRPVMVKADTLFLPGGGGPGTGGGQPIGFLGMDVTDSNGNYQIDIDLALFTGTQVYVVTHGCLLSHYVVPVQAIAGVTTVNFSVCVMVPGGGNPGGGNPGGGNPGGGCPGGGNPGGGNPGGGNPGGGHPGGGLPGMGCHAYFGGHPDTANLLTWNFQTMPKSPTATYDWSFGDGNTTSGLSVSNTYAAFGQYNVCLVLTDTAFQCADTFCKLINVDSTFTPGGGHPGGGHPGGGNPGGGNPGGGHPGGGLPGMGCHAYFGGHPDTANLLTWNFQTMPKSPTATYDWSFGDGNTASGLSVSNTYAAFGQYNVCLVLTDTAFQCVDTFCMLINVDSTFTPGGGHPGGGNPGGGQGMNCNADFAWFVDSSNNVVFNDLSTPVPTSWAWDFGDGNTSVSQNPVYAYASAGTYYVTLEIGYTNCSCIDSTSQSVTVAVSVSMVMGTAQITGIEYVSDIYPNPVTDVCRLDMEVMEAGEVMVSLLDLSGKVIQSQTRMMNRGVETIELNTASLNEGVYLMVVRHQNGNLFTRKLNKIR